MLSRQSVSFFLQFSETVFGAPTSIPENHRFEEDSRKRGRRSGQGGDNGGIFHGGVLDLAACVHHSALRADDPAVCVLNYDCLVR
jgi:coproporphyrinogen III oxidase